MFWGLISPSSGSAQLHKTTVQTCQHLQHVVELYWFPQSVIYSRRIGAVNFVTFLVYNNISKLQNIWSLQLLHA
jgi:hypothetical protein